MPSKKSQIQIMETIAVLAVFFILVMLGFIFYSKVLKGNIWVEEEESAQLDAIKIAQRASSLPELQCSQENAVEDNCIDILSLEALSGIINENRIYYFGKFAFSKIAVNEIYPNENEWVIYDEPLEDYSYKIIADMPISLFNPVENKYAFGVMNVEVFSKQ